MPSQTHATIDHLEPALPARPLRVPPRPGQPRRARTRGSLPGEGRDADILVLRRSAATAATSVGTFRGMLIGVLVSVPIWAALVWLVIG